MPNLRGAKKEPKPKKDPKRNMPEGGDLIAGFRKASTLAKRKQRSSDIDESGRSDADVPPINETHSQRMQRLLTMTDEQMEAEFAKRDASLDSTFVRPRKGAELPWRKPSLRRARRRWRRACYRARRG